MNRALAIPAASILLSIGVLAWGLSGQNRALIDDCNKWNIAGEVVEKVALSGCPTGEEYDPLELQEPDAARPLDPCTLPQNKAECSH